MKLLVLIVLLFGLAHETHALPLEPVIPAGHENWNQLVHLECEGLEAIVRENMTIDPPTSTYQVLRNDQTIVFWKVTPEFLESWAFNGEMWRYHMVRAGEDLSRVDQTIDLAMTEAGLDRQYEICTKQADAELKGKNEN
jgi:hypothetical protein